LEPKKNYIKNMKKIILSFFLLTSVAINAQRTCGVEEKLQKIMADPIQREIYLKGQEKFEKELEKLNNRVYRSGESIDNVNATTRIPMAFHFPSVSPSASATLKNCLRALAQNQVNSLNADYNATNADISNWASAASFYPTVSGVGSIDIQFVIATQNHPAGTGIANGTVAVTFGTNFLNGADEDPTWAGYMNVVVRNEGGILGYSPLGGYPGAGWTVVLNTWAFGSGSGCSGYVPGVPPGSVQTGINKGRTLTHELGHFFNLNHTFNGCGTNCNFTGDRVCDTPPSSVEQYGCPSPGSITSSCGTNKVLTMNYMDYTDDACMYMFTPGQMTRVQAWYNSIADEFNMTTLSNNEVVKNNFNIFPNPNNGTFTIRFNDLSDDYSVEVFDISGRIVFEDYYTQSSNLEQTISIDKPSSGVYFVNVKSRSSIITEKIIIK
jgi:hypothetical protein